MNERPPLPVPLLSPPHIAPGAPADAPSAVTFFVTAAQRAALLKRLRTLHRDRAAALLIALDLHRTGDKP
jgi:hypothetical protein